MPGWCLAVLVAVCACVLGAGPSFAGDPVFGRWSLDPKGCGFLGGSAAAAPLTISDKSIDGFGSRCTIRKNYKIGDALHLEARCWTDGRMKDIPISLMPRGGKLAVTWDRKPAGEMTRCP
jgi:hypothetical protein